MRELCRVAAPETEAEWLRAVEGKTAREVERLVSGRARGDRPTDRAKPEAEIKRLTLTLNAESYAALKEARVALALKTGHPVDDDAFAKLLADAVMREGAERADAGASAYQIALVVCPSCEHATQRAGGEEVTVDEVALEAARCDATHAGRVDGTSHSRATRSVPPRVKRAVDARQKGRCAVPGCSNRMTEVHHCDPVSEGGTHDPERLCGLCGAHHRPAHVGRLVIRGTYSGGFVFEHADGTPYGSPAVDAASADDRARVFEALKGMGFREREARQMLDAVSTHTGDRDALLRAALRQAAMPRGVCEDRAVYRRLPAFGVRPLPTVAAARARRARSLASTACPA